MMRKIAIAMTALMLAISIVGCGSQYDGNVSDTTNGTINSSSGRYRDGLKKEETPADSKQRTHDNSMTSDNGSMIDDAKDAATDIGRAIDDAGSAIGDSMVGNDQTAGAGMTGSR